MNQFDRGGEWYLNRNLLLYIIRIMYTYNIKWKLWWLSLPSCCDGVIGEEKKKIEEIAKNEEEIVVSLIDFNVSKYFEEMDSGLDDSGTLIY